MINSKWFGEKDECLSQQEQLFEVNSCAPHEPTHVFVAGTVLHRSPPWLDEGLATYVSAQLRTDQILECLAGSFRFIFEDQYTGEVKEKGEGDYVSLAVERKQEDLKNNASFRDAYFTGACLWDHIDANYGHETFKAIMRDVNASRFSYMSFVSDILEHHIGESGIDDLKNKFGDDSIKVFE